MIGYVLSLAQATAINDAVAAAQTSRGLPVYWLPGKYEIFTGPHAGDWFMPMDDRMLTTNLREGLTPQDFPEFGALSASLGGLESRVEIDAASLVDPNAPTD